MLSLLVFVTLLINIVFAGNWNDLKVTWGINPLDSNYFQSVPINEQNAIKAGWKLEKDCSQINGRRYVKGNDRSVLLVFDSNGGIAGIATAVPKNLPFNFPSPSIKPYFQDEGDSYVMTAYFVEPKTVCNAAAKSSLTYGDRVVIQGQYAQAVLPLNQKDAVSSSFWTEGHCFYTMGQHFWSNVQSVPITPDMNADDFFPLCLLYNSGKLNGFCFAFNADLTSERYEHPQPSQLNMFLKPVPNFLSDPTKAGKLSTIHVYLDNTPRLNFC